MSQRYGIIDIGSNSIRLVIYEKTEQDAYRVVDGSKRAARLSSKVSEQGALSQEGIDLLIETLSVFQLVAAQHSLTKIVPLATAAIRNATNQSEILSQVRVATGLEIIILSGLEEAEYGFLGMINSISIQDGFLLDIGGGSSELTLFLDRKIVHSFSFPFGCVSMNKRYDSKTGLSDELQARMKAEIRAALDQHDWISRYSQLPLVAVGGTARALGKIHQAAIDYPLAQTHNYHLSAEAVNTLLLQLRALPQDKRKKTAGLSKDRVDVIVPGLSILTTIYDYINATHYIICGAGLRDGIFHKLSFPEQPIKLNPLTYSTDNIVALHTPALREHVTHISEIATKLLRCLMEKDVNKETYSRYVQTAAKLYRIGTTIDYSNFAKHTFYLIVHSHLSGLNHRELLLIAGIASFRSKGKVKNELKGYESIITANDLEIIYRLGTLLQLAIALDRSEAQAMCEMELKLEDDKLYIIATTTRSDMQLEGHSVAEIAGDFKKQWGVKPILSYGAAPLNEDHYVR